MISFLERNGLLMFHESVKTHQQKVRVLIYASIMVTGYTLLAAIIAMIFTYSVKAFAQTPDPKLTPGKLSGATQEQVCKAGFTKDSRHVTAKMKRLVFERYGFVKGQYKPGDYEIDHLISLELGGANDIENLWPQPYGGDFGARKKDVIETYFHRQICKGRMTLKEAQDRIRTNWVGEYESWKALQK